MGNGLSVVLKVFEGSAGVGRRDLEAGEVWRMVAIIEFAFDSLTGVFVKCVNG